MPDYPKSSNDPTRYVFDLDGTLADLDHRLPFIQSENPDWESFNASVGEDKPILPVIKLLTQLDAAQNTVVEIWSGRMGDEDTRSKTMMWLATNGIRPGLLTHMRPEGNFLQDNLLKQKWLTEAIEKGQRPDMVFDDRQRLVDMWRANGIICAQVAQWEEQS